MCDYCLRDQCKLKVLSVLAIKGTGILININFSNLYITLNIFICQWKIKMATDYMFLCQSHVLSYVMVGLVRIPAPDGSIGRAL